MDAIQLVHSLKKNPPAVVVVLGGGRNALEVAEAFQEEFHCRIFLITKNLPEKSLRVPLGVDVRVTQKLTRDYFESKFTGLNWERALLVSAGSQWIVEASILDLFKGRAINFHPGALPGNRGASAASWAIMNQDHAPRVTLHVMDGSIDSGQVILEELIPTPRPNFTMDEIIDGLSQAVIVLILNFSKLLQSQENLAHSLTSTEKSNYFPPISASRNGWIDWSWHGREILSFIKAFSAPYQGASTYHHKKHVRILNAAFLELEGSLHPFSYGLVVGKSDGLLRLAVLGGEIHIRDGDLVRNSKPYSHIRIGDRLHTPLKRVDESRFFRRKNI